MSVRAVVEVLKKVSSATGLVSGPLKLTLPAVARAPLRTHTYWNVQLPLPVKVIVPEKSNIGPAGPTLQGPSASVFETHCAVGVGEHVAVSVNADAGTGVGVGGGGGVVGGGAVGGGVLAGVALRAGCGMGVAEAVGLGL